MADTISSDRRIIAPGVGIFAIFAIATAASVFAALLSPTPHYTRVAYTIWPCILMGGLAIAIALNQAPRYRTRPWRFAWGLGFLGYLFHLWLALDTVFDWDIVAVFESQGVIVAAANFLLLPLWGISAVAAYLGRNPPWLHLAAMALFIATSVASTVLFAGGAGLFGGVLLLLGWVAALLLRRAPPKSV